MIKAPYGASTEVVTGETAQLPGGVRTKMSIIATIIKAFIPFTKEWFICIAIFLVVKVLYSLSPSGRRAAEEKRKAERERKIREQKLQAKINAERLAAIARDHALRDADHQDTPYTYNIGRHANEALAIRYGIANQRQEISEYWYYAKGGNRVRNPERDTVKMVPSGEIKLRKISKVGHNKFLVALSSHRDREAIAVIEKGTDYVKTFYPLSEDWFKKNRELEVALKGNGTFGLKELARLHIEKAVQRK